MILELLYSVKCFFVGHDWQGNVIWLCGRCGKFEYNTPESKRRQNELIIKMCDLAFEYFIKNGHIKDLHIPSK